MPAFFLCPYLRAEAELTDEREAHIADRHSTFVPYLHYIAPTLAEPDLIRGNLAAPNARRFYRSYDDVERGKYVVVVVVSDVDLPRHWIVTAHLANRASGGILEWARS